jgi:DNA uptake protein ComE-like DNA-binding protein
MKSLKKNQAFAVILMISVIALLTVIAVGFIVITKLDIDISFYSNENLKALNLADAGIQRIIGEIQKDVKTEFIDDTADAWIAGYSDNTLLSGLGEYDVTAIDCQRQVNINNASANLLEELPGIDAALASAIIAARPYETKRQLMNAAGIAEGTYDNLKDYITVISWRDSSCSNRSPININTADEVVIKAVLKGTGLSDASVDTAYAAISNALTTLGPFYRWSDFDNIIDTASLSAAEKDLIKTNANPNRVKPANNTTEFCFFSGGYYEITSTGTVYETTAQSKAAATRTINTVVQLFKTIYYTTKEDFRGEDANYNLSLDTGEDTNGNGSLDVPTIHMVNWMDSCPVNSTEDNGFTYASGYEKIDDSLKLGFWDNFDEDNDNTNKEGWSWINWTNEEEAQWPMVISDDDSDGDDELYGEINASMMNCWAKFKLEDSRGWLLENEFSFRGHAANTFRVGGTGYEDGCAVEFHKSTLVKAKLCFHRFGYWYPGQTDITVTGSTVASDPASGSYNGKDYLDSLIYLALIDGKNQIRVYNIGNVLYGITPCATDHYNNWMNDEFNDSYHGVTPEEATYKLIVSSDYTPNYRVYIAPSDTFHSYYRYTDGGFFSSIPCAALGTDYIYVPIDQSSEMHFDRYDYYARGNSGSNTWNTINSYLVLQHHQQQYLWDEVRVIVPSGSYESYWHQPDEGTVGWGSILWNTTIPVSASSFSETVSAEVNTGSGYSLINNNGPVDANSDRCRFKLTLASNDDDYSETPILEDITITYIIEPKTVYYSYRSE